jgi:hypothetical protein
MAGKLKSALSVPRRSVSQALRGEERLWIVWWGGGFSVALISAALMIAAERVRSLGAWAWGWGDACDAARLVVYVAWFLPAWRCSKNVRRAVWTPLARVALLAGLVLSVMF